MLMGLDSGPAQPVQVIHQQRREGNHQQNHRPIFQSASQREVADHRNDRQTDDSLTGVQPKLGDQEAHDWIGFLQAVADAVGCGRSVGGLEQQEGDKADIRDGHESP